MIAQLRMPTPRKLALSLVGVVATLIALSMLVQIVHYVLGFEYQMGLVPLFYVDEEANIPTWYSSIALLYSSLLLATIGKVKWDQGDRFRWHWCVLSGIFLLLSIDEVSMLHEYPIDPLRNTLGAGGLLYFTWVIPGMIFVAAVGIGFLKFLIHLPARTRYLFLVAGAVFVGGAIGVEMLSGIEADARTQFSLTYALIVTVEEMMEMLGIVLFIYALSDYISRHIGELRVQFALKPESGGMA